MAEDDLVRFLYKVDQLTKLVRLIEKSPQHRGELSACNNHNQVVSLARAWGFEIGRRWGEPDFDGPRLEEENLLGVSLPQEGEERKVLIQKGHDWRLELIASCSYSNEKGFWYKQSENEWILLLRGSATLILKEPDQVHEMNVGNHLYLAPYRPHHVLRTDPSPGTLWVALSWK